MFQHLNINKFFYFTQILLDLFKETDFNTVKNSDFNDSAYKSEVF